MTKDELMSIYDSMSFIKELATEVLEQDQINKLRLIIEKAKKVQDKIIDDVTAMEPIK